MSSSNRHESRPLPDLLTTWRPLAGFDGLGHCQDRSGGGHTPDGGGVTVTVLSLGAHTVLYRTGQLCIGNGVAAGLWPLAAVQPTNVGSNSSRMSGSAM